VYFVWYTWAVDSFIYTNHKSKAEGVRTRTGLARGLRQVIMATTTVTTVTTTTTMEEVNDHETLPSSAFESLLPKLLAILQVTQRPEGTGDPRNKQDLLQAVSAVFTYARSCA
jgi:hypothetical protein